MANRQSEAEGRRVPGRRSRPTRTIRAKADRAESRALIACSGARALGLAACEPIEVVRLVKVGFPFSRIKQFERTSGLSQEKIARFAAIPQRTLSRRQNAGRLAPDESDRVLRASRVFEMAAQLFDGDAAAASEWLQTPQPALGGAIPLEFASTGVGAHEVESLIGRLEHGATT